MALVDIINTQGEKVSEKELPDSIFNVPVKSSVLHEVVKMQLAKRRAGTAKVKRRSEIRGSRRKLFRQKGTGRARRGDIKSPVLRGGGVVFGPYPKDYGFNVPKKKRALALKMALSSKLQSNELVVVDQFKMDRIKTKEFVETIKTIDRPDSLIIIDGEDRNMELSSRNVKGVKVLRSRGLNVYDILRFKNLVLLESSIESIEGRFA